MVLLAAAGTAVQLVPDGTIFLHIALILLMIWILNRTFFRPINRVIESREKNKGGRLGEAGGILAEVSEKQAKYDTAIREARLKGYSMIEQERQEALARKAAAVGQVKHEVAETVASETAELEKQTAEARAALAQEAERMAEKISSNILKTV